MRKLLGFALSAVLAAAIFAVWVAPIENFMDFTHDSCMYTLSDGQGSRMQEITALYKPSLGYRYLRCRHT